MEDTAKPLPNIDVEQAHAALFEAISHPTRIRIINALRIQSLGFADLKHALKISGNGTLQHHLQKLGDLIQHDATGKYTLSDLGYEAFLAIHSGNDSKPFLLHPTQQGKLFALIGALALYIVQLNIPIFFGTVSILTPIYALSSAIVFGILQWAMWKVILDNRTMKDE